MKVLFLSLAIFMFPYETKAGFYDGNELYGYCKGNGFEEGACYGYVSGVVDMIIFLKEYNQTLFKNICIPNGVNLRQAVDVVVNYLRDNPHNRHNFAERNSVLALEEAFPCR